MVKLFDEEELDRVFYEISEKLEFPVEGFLLGGLAMMKNKMKNSTKDIDIVFSNEREAKTFIEAGQAAGFWLETDLPPEYEELGSRYVLKDKEERWIDVFVKVVVNKLEYTDSMQERAKQLDYGKLTIQVSSISDIFLFKSVATRPRDLDDMALLARTGYVDWSVVEDEARTQATPWKWVTKLYERLVELEEKRGISAPIMRSLEKERDLGQGIENVILFLETGPLERNELIKKFDARDTGFIEEVILKMIKLGVVKEEDDKLIYCP